MKVPVGIKPPYPEMLMVASLIMGVSVGCALVYVFFMDGSDSLVVLCAGMFGILAHLWMGWRWYGRYKLYVEVMAEWQKGRGCVCEVRLCRSGEASQLYVVLEDGTVLPYETAFNPEDLLGLTATYWARQLPGCDVEYARVSVGPYGEWANSSN